MPPDPYRFPSGQYPDPESTVPFEEWLLDAKRYGMTQSVSPYLLEALEGSTVMSRETGHMIVQLNAKILTRDVNAYDVTAQDWVPATWWDHYKHTLWESSRGDGWQRRAERRLWRLLRLDHVKWQPLTVTLHVQEFVAFPEADPALAHTLGSGVPKRIVTGPTWLDRFRPSRGDTDD